MQIYTEEEKVRVSDPMVHPNDKIPILVAVIDRLAEVVEKHDKKLTKSK